MNAGYLSEFTGACRADDFEAERDRKGYKDDLILSSSRPDHLF